MENPLRVLVVAPLGVGGVTNMMVNIQKRIDRTKVNFDYLTFHDRKEPMEDIVCSLGSKKIVASVDNIKIKPLRRIARMYMIAKVCKDNNIEVMHYNADGPIDMTNIIAAKRGGVKYITIHSHNASAGNAGKLIEVFGCLLRPLIPRYCNSFWGCSDLAARFLLPKSIIDREEYTVVPNGIDLDKYDYNELVRTNKRAEMGLQEKLVIGHAGRFCNQKNQDFLIDVFDQIHKKNDKAVLILFGVGEMLDKIKSKVQTLGLNDCVTFMGASDEMHVMWQVIDLFVMPSLHEGLPVTGIEAQASGVKCFFSSEITREVDVSGNSTFIGLDKSADEWANTVLQYSEYNRKSGVTSLREARYDIRDTAKFVEEHYINVGKCIVEDIDD